MEHFLRAIRVGSGLLERQRYRGLDPSGAKSVRNAFSVLLLPEPRIDELAAHHEARCAAILDACQDRPLTPAELVPVVFRRPIEDPHQMGFAFSETLAHVNLLSRQGRLRPANGGRYVADWAVPATGIT